MIKKLLWKSPVEPKLLDKLLPDLLGDLVPLLLVYRHHLLDVVALTARHIFLIITKPSLRIEHGRLLTTQEPLHPILRAGVEQLAVSGVRKSVVISKLPSQTRSRAPEFILVKSSATKSTIVKLKHLISTKKY